MRKEKWKRFEDLAAHIQRTLAPDATVEQNVRIPGKSSGVERQVDIVVRARAGQYDLFVAIDCKDYKRKVDVKAVEQFIGLSKDVGANKGAMIAFKGFSQAAKTRARRAGIDLYTLVDAEEHEWKSYVSIPTVIEYTRIHKYQFSFDSTGPCRLPTHGYSEMCLYRADGTPIGIMKELMLRQWNRQAIPHKAGTHLGISLSPDDTHVMTDGILYRVIVRANVEVGTTLYFGHLPLVEVQGFEDELSGGLVTRSFTTADLDLARVQEDWQVIRSRDELAIRPVFTWLISSYHPTSEEELK